VNLILHLDT